MIMLRHLTQLGADFRWVSKFVPVIMPDAEPKRCAPYRFAQVKMGQRQQLRTAYAALLKDRLARNAPPVRVPPPQVIDRAFTASALVVVEGGCLMCGVGHQTVPAITVAREGRGNVARDLWTPKRTGTQQLGGPPSPATVSGHLGRVCNDAVEAFQSIGPSALERALVAVLAPDKVGLLPYGQFSMNGLVGWGALVARDQQGDPPAPDPMPNGRPWEHLGELAALGEQLGAALS